MAIDGTGEIPNDLTNLKTTDFTPSEKAQILAKYSHLDPEHLVPNHLLEEAVIYYGLCIPHTAKAVTAIMSLIYANL